MSEFAAEGFSYLGVARYRNLEDGSILTVDTSGDAKVFLNSLLDELQSYMQVHKRPAAFRIEYCERLASIACA